MKFLIDECLHASLVAVAQSQGHEAFHVNWLGLSGETDRGLMPKIVGGDFTFVTNNARDFRKLYARETLHAGLIIILPQLVPARQRELFDAVLDEIAAQESFVNEAIEIDLEADVVTVTRYALPSLDP